MRSVLALLVLWELSAMGCSQDVTKLYEAKRFNSTVFDPSNVGASPKLSLPYRLLKPARIEPGKLYPLVLFLHGAGERGDDNEKQLMYLPTWLASDKNRRSYPCFVIAPQCPDDERWSDVTWGEAVSQPIGAMTKPMRTVVALLDDFCEHNPVDPARIYLTGLSMGAYGSWDLAERMPERFAALVPVCGGGDETQASRLVGLPIWAWHGDEDKAVPVERSQRMIAAIEAAGGTPRYTELKGVGHDSWVQAYDGPDNVLSWMFEQVKPAPVAQ
ncbi:MAG TPA: dienelactone hydrolase family protein [Pirellulales bacterium]|nr:dienelactone hydrolase family protein [Pirellulales bacterium]